MSNAKRVRCDNWIYKHFEYLDVLLMMFYRVVKKRSYKFIKLYVNIDGLTNIFMRNVCTVCAARHKIPRICDFHIERSLILALAKR